jgi:uncharacterized membrane protein
VFDTITGIPVHPLVVHAVVVFLPLACLATAAVAVRPAWRRYSPWLVAFNGAVMVATFVARQSGERLERRISQFQTPPGLPEHTQWGSRLFLLSVALFLGALVVWFTRSMRGLATVVGVLAVVGAVLTIGVTVYVGHTGATAVWKQTIENTTGLGED